MRTKIEQSETLIHSADKFFKILSRQKLPDFWIFGSGIQQDFPRSCDACQTLTVAWIKEWKVFLKDEEYISDAISDLMKMQTDEPIRASLRQEFSI